ncbi:MAG: DUF2330 domain-containing protein [Trueperaceae bacterium]|nr:MAG: DUF2330 domain-containing protein [Trueperaceae bacterium]
MKPHLPTKRLWLLLGILLFGSALAFCGFFVAKADARLFNESSKVILARDGNRTILTMANDYQGDVSDFALVVPVPVVLDENQVQVGDPAIMDRIDAYSAPRLVEYYDEDPCAPVRFLEAESMAVPAPSMAFADARANALGVTIEAQFSVGEYDILILSAEQSDGLETWLLENGFNIPVGASDVLQRYIRQGMKFFVAQVNLEAFEASGFQFLRPLLMAFESERFMLPIQLGMVNARGPQDLIVYLMTPQGRVDVSNYRTVNIPSDVNLPEFVEEDFADFYQAMFQHNYEREGEDIVFVEYAWDMSWCDPCAADPLSADELLRSGVFWLDEQTDFGAPNVFLTRLHVRYTADKFPEDLFFKVTDDRENFQGRYILQRPFQGELTCEAGRDYVKNVQQRREREAQTLANLTGWPIADIRARMGPFNPQVAVAPWWERVFDRFKGNE